MAHVFSTNSAYRKQAQTRGFEPHKQKRDHELAVLAFGPEPPLPSNIPTRVIFVNGPDMDPAEIARAIMSPPLGDRPPSISRIYFSGGPFAEAALRVARRLAEAKPDFDAELRLAPKVDCQ
jgi:hypothetical protein